MLSILNQGLDSNSKGCLQPIHGIANLDSDRCIPKDDMGASFYCFPLKVLLGHCLLGSGG